MDAATLIRELREAGFTLRPRGDDRLAVSPAERLTPCLRMAIREHKAELLERLTPEYPEAPCGECGGRTFYMTRECAWACLECSDVPQRIPRRWWIGPTRWLDAGGGEA